MPRTRIALLPPPDVIRFFKALADETRLSIVRLLALTDLRAGEIVEYLDLPHNRVSYHLRQLRGAGLLRDRRSSHDARDIYYSVDLDRLDALYAAAGAALNPGKRERTEEASAGADANPPLRVLFLCTHNSARSQLAEAILRHLGGDQVQAFSAGSEPTEVHPMTLELLEEQEIDARRHTSESMETFTDQQFDYVITVCDQVRENCPTFPGEPEQIHWSIPDPVVIEDDAERRAAFREIWGELNTRIRYLLLLPHPATGRRFSPRS